MSSLLIPIQMRFGDIDSYGHVNNVTMLQYLEDARVRLMSGPLPGGAVAGAPADATFRSLLGDRMTVIGRQEVEYTEQLLYRADPVFVRVWVSSVGGSSFVLDYAVQEEDGSRVYAVAQTVVVVIDRSTGRPERLDEAPRSALAQWSDASTRFARRPVPAEA
ncbi:thioesterase family protein [uncultured Kocuria sp.]|uniref:acyl-CoA thioesterase n=1 Tax=uncultured Kocuria sp. TaxID=259305 RepID=UPI0026399204|nr:thioesterase family protein [uncultured Kocuria sp.]